MKYFIGADLGTSSLKLILCDKEGRIIASVLRTYDVKYPAPGFSEQDPYDWWEAFASGVKELTEKVDR